MGAKDIIEEVICKDSGKIYLPPCQIKCPVGEDIQRTNAMLSILPVDESAAAEQVIKIGDEIFEKNPMFTICGYVCGLCEQECNYKDQTGAIRRRMLKRFISDYYMSYMDKKAALPAPTKDKIAVVGGGPGGLMAMYELARRGYKVTVFERDKEFGGALRYIPIYRMPKSVLDGTLNNLARMANAQVEFGSTVGEGGKTLDDLKNEGYKAVFIATGTPAPRPLTFGGNQVAGADLDGVMFGLPLLLDANQGTVAPDMFKGKRVLVIGGGNVAFDVARVARRLGGDVSMACLECADKCCNDGIPADIEEIEGAEQEGITIHYCRGVSEIIGENGKFKKTKSPKCTSVFDDKGFNPQFDSGDAIELEADVLLITIGQGAERGLFQQGGMLNDSGRLDVDPVTLMSNQREGVFVGGDVRRIGFAAEAILEGITAAESIDRYIKGEDMKADREKEYEKAEAARLENYKPQPQLQWVDAKDRLNFDLFEIGFTLEQARAEAKRCLYCGPCLSCKGCVVGGIQIEIPAIEVNEDICSGCGVCVAVCPYDARKLEKRDGGTVAIIDDQRCKRCGVCVSACPSGANKIVDELEASIAGTLAAIRG
ncbi:MAG: FAD-dependent oxidoreductase [Chloroflexota bacterium]|nr:FAD-dependent oxidoreductase [Chloroflexota bacterium]